VHGDCLKRDVAMRAPKAALKNRIPGILNLAPSSTRRQT
jgi:hypothetical protein